MTERPPITVGEREWERGLWWMVLASGAVHLLAIASLLLMPRTFLHQPPPVASYTVDLVAPDVVGGNNMIQGGKGRVEAPPMAAAPKLPPPPPKVEEPKPPEPPKVEAHEVEKKPPPEPPKAEEKAKENEVALAEKVKPTAPPAPPTVAKPVPTIAKPAPSPKAVAKPTPPKMDAKAAKAAAEAKAAEAKAAKAAAEAKARDQRIAAAVKRIEQQGTRGGGVGAKVGEQPGGPLSVGPGEGVGGTIKGVEYVMYRHQLETKIRQNWNWAGAQHSLEAAIHFSILETGDVVDVRIVKSSGDVGYDRSVERAVRAVNPLPPPPEQYRKEFRDVEYTFTPESLQM